MACAKNLILLVILCVIKFHAGLAPLLLSHCLLIPLSTTLCKLNVTIVECVSTLTSCDVFLNPQIAQNGRAKIWKNKTWVLLQLNAHCNNCSSVWCWLTRSLIIVALDSVVSSVENVSLYTKTSASLLSHPVSKALSYPLNNTRKLMKRFDTLLHTNHRLIVYVCRATYWNVCLGKKTLIKYFLNVCCPTWLTIWHWITINVC